MKIIGVGGLPRSGKDMVGDFLMAHGYFGVSLGDIVREEARRRHADKPEPISLKNMTETSNFLRTTKGPDFALQEALKRFEAAGGEQEHKGLVVFSVRVPVEVEFITAQGGELIWVEARDDVRLARANKHRREGEPEHTLENMKDYEALQQKPQPGIPVEVQMDTDYVKAHATIVIENNGDSLVAFEDEVKKQLARVL